MASYDHWLSDDGIAFAKALQGKSDDVVGHGAFADYLEEHGDPLHVVVRRSPKYVSWIKSQTGDPGMYPLGDGSSHEGYIIRSHPDRGMGLDMSLGHDRAKAAGEPYFYVHHKVIGSKRQAGGRYSLIASSVNFPGAVAGSTNDRSRFVAPVTKDELKAILEFHRGRRDHGMVGGIYGGQAARRALKSKAVGEHPMTGEDPLTLAREDMHPRIAAEAREYHEAHRNTFGLDLPADGPGPRFDPELSRRAAQAFERAKHLPEHPRVKEAYQALKQEILAQHTFLESKGVKFEPWTKDGQPYANSAEMAHDARENRHLHYFPTQQGYGQGHEEPQAHPLLEPVPGRPGVVYNDLFRAVHDYFGHAMKGHQFGPKGELQAWGEHARMFSPKARLALTAETHGQNSWVNFGPHSDKPVTERPYAEQKATILPKNVVPKMEPTKMARGDALLGPEGSDEPDEDSITPARVLRNTQRVVWRSGPSGHVVGLPQTDGTTLVRRFGSVAEAKPHVMEWAKGAAPEHKASLLGHLRSMPTPAIVKPTLAPTTPPVAKRVQVARPTTSALLGKTGPNVVQYQPGMEPPAKLARVDFGNDPDVHAFLKAILENPNDSVTHGAFADYLEERGDPLHAIVRRSVAYRSHPSYRLGWGEELPGNRPAWTHIARPRGVGDNPYQPEVLAVHRRDRGDQSGKTYFTVESTHYLPDASGSASAMNRVMFSSPVTRDELREIFRSHMANRPTPGTQRSGGTRAFLKETKNPKSTASEPHEMVTQLDRSESQAAPNHPEMLRRVLAGNLDGAKKFLEDAGDPLAHVLDSRSRYSADSNTNLCCGPNTLKTYGHATNHQATVRLMPSGEVEAVFRQVGEAGPKAVGFRKRLDPEAVRAIVAYHRQPEAPRGAVGGEPEKMAGPELQASNREPIRVKTVGGRAGVSLRLPDANPIKLTRRRQFQGWWLSPKGKMHRTGYVSHARYAKAKHGKSVDDMHAEGWHRVARFGGSRLHVLKGGKGLNDHQRKAVKSHAEKRELAVGREPEGADAQAARNPAGPSGLAQALKDLQSQRQVVRKQLAARIAQEAGVQLAAVLDSASIIPHPRAGIVQQLQHNDRDTLNYAAAWYGMLAREPRLTVFHEGDGNDVLHVTNSPLGVSQILEAAGQHRLPGVSVSPKGAIHVVDAGGQNTSGVMRFLQDVRAVRPNTVRGEAHRIGSASGDPSDSRAAYRDVIKNFQGG